MNKRHMQLLAGLSAWALVGWSVLPAHAEEGPPSTSPGVPAGPPYSSLLPQPRDRGFEVAMQMCFVTLTVVPVTEANARRYVPAEYGLARDVGPQLAVYGASTATASHEATAIAWDFACDRTIVPGGPPGPARLSLVAVHISRAPSADLHATGIPPNVFANTWNHYLVWAHTDNPALAGHLHKAGIPIEVVDTFRFHSNAVGDDITVTSRLSPYRVTNNANVDDVVFGPHDHTNEFWFGAAPHATVLRLRVHYARDLECILTVQVDCRGEIEAPAGSAVADLLGSTKVATRYAARHHKIPVVNASTHRSGEPRLAARRWRAPDRVP
jgi:hypothetical protein